MSDDFTEKYGERKPPEREPSDRGARLARLAYIVFVAGVVLGVALGLQLGAVTDGDLIDLTVVNSGSDTYDTETSFNWLLFLLAAGPAVIAAAVLEGASVIVKALED